MSTAPPPLIPGLSEAERIADIFVAPSKTFADILRNASWWGPLVLLIVFSIASAYTVQTKVGFDRAYLHQLHASPTQEDRINGLDPEAKANALALGTKITRGVAYGGPVLILVILAIYSLVIWAAFNFGLGAETKFSQVFAVSMYAALPYLLLNVLIILTVSFGAGDDTFNYQNPVGTNLAFYLPDAAGWLKGLLSALDVVKLWSTLLQVIGMVIISKKTFAQSATIVGIFWVLGLIIATIGGAFSG